MQVYRIACRSENTHHPSRSWPWRPTAKHSEMQRSRKTSWEQSMVRAADCLWETVAILMSITMSTKASNFWTSRKKTDYKGHEMERASKSKAIYPLSQPQRPPTPERPVWNAISSSLGMTVFECCSWIHVRFWESSVGHSTVNENPYQRLFPPRGAELEEVNPPIYQRPC
jgi:hypothetical protein